MGIDRDFGRAYAKAQRAAGLELPLHGTVLVSVRDQDKRSVSEAVRVLAEEGFRVAATRGTAEFLKDLGISAELLQKAGRGAPDTVDAIRDRSVDLVIVTTRLGDPRAVRDSASMRRAALEHGVPCFTTAAGARAAAGAIRAIRSGGTEPIAIQDLHDPL
jgi:carbamoyl-phosphate synthase large subunit